MKKLYPLKLTPVLREKTWGSEKLLVSGLDGSPSVVENGFLADNDLPDILETYMGDLVGDEVFEYFNLQFPVTVKQILAKQNLSVQVHPDDNTAMVRYDSYGKDEMLFVTDVQGDAGLYIGFKEKIDATQLFNACADGSVVDLLQEFRPEKGGIYHIPAGTVHAIGGGVSAVEVSQPGDITFRLYDWGRENNPDTRREMNIEEALDLIDYGPWDPSSQCRGLNVVTVRLAGKTAISTEEFKSALIYTCIRGNTILTYKDVEYSLREGETMLVPASLDEFVLSPENGECTLIRATVPETGQDTDSYITNL